MVNWDGVIRKAKMAVDTGVWSLKDAGYCHFIHRLIVRKRKPVEEYLKMQGGFEHLFKPVRLEKVIQGLQKRQTTIGINITK